jgi:hypothetical protein
MGGAEGPSGSRNKHSQLGLIAEIHHEGRTTPTEMQETALLLDSDAISIMFLSVKAWEFSDTVRKGSFEQAQKIGVY